MRLECINTPFQVDTKAIVIEKLRKLRNEREQERTLNLLSASVN